MEYLVVLVYVVTGLSVPIEKYEEVRPDSPEVPLAWFSSW